MIRGGNISAFVPKAEMQMQRIAPPPPRKIIQQNAAVICVISLISRAA